MKYPEFKNKNVTIWGLGIYGNGPAAIKFFSDNGANVTVTDMKPETEFKEVLKELKDYKDVKYIFGKNSEENILNCDLLFRAPAIPIEVPLLQQAIKKGINVQMSEGFFIKHSPTKNIIGITGTKGKSTTSSYIHQALNNMGVNAYLAGTPQNSAMSLLEVVGKDDWVVLEIASYDCEGLDFNKVSPRISAITNISQDHLFRYESYEAYAMSKASIFKYQKNGDVLILGNQNEFLKEYGKNIRSGVEFVVVDDEYELEGIDPRHNLKGLRLAYVVLLNAGFIESDILQALKNVQAPRYRQEEIGQANGIKFVNDTTATVPPAAIYAMQNYKNERPVVILGGSTKKIDYTSLVNYVIDNKVEYVLLEGTGTDEYIKLGLDRGKVYDDFEEAIREAYRRALKIKGFVLLAPGTHSFGMFKNEFDRGDQFNEIFEKIKNENNV